MTAGIDSVNVWRGLVLEMCTNCVQGLLQLSDDNCRSGSAAISSLNAVRPLRLPPHGRVLSPGFFVEPAEKVRGGWYLQHKGQN